MPAGCDAEVWLILAYNFNLEGRDPDFISIDTRLTIKIVTPLAMYATNPVWMWED